MTLVSGKVGVGAGWPPLRSGDRLDLAVRASSRLTVGDVVAEPIYGRVPVALDGSFSFEAEPGYWLVRISGTGYDVVRALLVPDSETADYATLVEVDPSTLDPLPDLPSSAELLVEVDAALDATIESGSVEGDNLILTRHDGTTVNAGNVRGPAGADGSGLVSYASTAALDAVADTELGVVTPATSWGAFFGNSAFNSYTGEALVTTIAGFRSGSVELTQTVDLGRHSNGYRGIYSRTKLGSSAWTAWALGVRVPTPSTIYDATTKAYVDARSNLQLAWADLDTLPANHGRTGFVTVTGADLGALTGIADLNGYPGGELRFESYGAYVNADYNQSQVQRVWIPRLGGALDVIERSRDDEPGYVMSAWTAWALL